MAVVLEYDGSEFAGWQYQDNAGTVQAALEQAVFRRFGERRRAGGASRTDAGVHAFGQVAVFDLAHRIPVRNLPAALNTALPAGVRILGARTVAAGWDPRRAAVRKSYVYLIFNRGVESPFWRGRAWHVPQRLALGEMRRAARSLVGRHDFSSFRGSGCEASSPVRTVRSLAISRRGDLVTLRISADAFLYHMVRIIAGTLAEVGRGRRRGADLRDVLAARDRRLAGPTAPACGLYLEKVTLGKLRPPRRADDGRRED